MYLQTCLNTYLMCLGFSLECALIYDEMERLLLIIVSWKTTALGLGGSKTTISFSRPFLGPTVKVMINE